jgi:apolipoprotein N-acyltransferase
VTTLAAARRVPATTSLAVVPVPPQSRPEALVEAVAGGLLTQTAFPDLSWWPMAALGIALLVMALHRASVRWAWLLGLVWGLGFFLPHLWWAREAAGPMPWLALAVAQAALLAAGTAAWATTMRWPWLRRTPWAMALAFTVTWVADEQLRSSWPFGGFPWGRLAFSQTSGPLRALAWLGGAPLVSAAVALIGFLVAQAWSAPRRERARSALAAATVIAAVVGLAATIPLASAAQAGTLRLAGVQGNVPDKRAVVADRARVVLDNHVAGTRTLLKSADPGSLDVVLWPENATDIDPRADESAAAAVERSAQTVGAPILLGADHRHGDGRYVQMLLWQPGRGAVFAYSKQRVVPFGEYIPARRLFRLFSSQVDRVGTDAKPGDQPAIVPLQVPRLGRVVPLATVICFEVAFDDVVRTAVRDGAQLIVVATNNASFGRTAEPTQQLAMTRLRAVEHGRAAVQISTVGVSAVIAPDGTVEQRTGLFTAATIRAELPLRTSLTPADRLGAAPVIVAVVLALAGLLAGAAAPDGWPAGTS